VTQRAPAYSTGERIGVETRIGAEMALGYVAKYGERRSCSAELASLAGDRNATAVSHERDFPHVRLDFDRAGGSIGHTFLSETTDKVR
jgi:hypothetical protein